MFWIIPMAGKGLRTQHLGEFKPFIEIKGNKILSWFLFSVRHLIRPDDEFVLITTQYFSHKFNFKKEVEMLFKLHGLPNKLHFVETQGTLAGTSLTVLQAEDLISANQPVLVIYPDQFIDFELPDDIKPDSGYLGLYLNFGNKSGFVEINNGLITKFVEKQNISNNASTGLYLLSSGKDLIKALKKQINSGETLNGEYYVGPSFNYLIEDGFHIFPLPVLAKYVLGDAEGIKSFEKRNLTVTGLPHKCNSDF